MNPTLRKILYVVLWSLIYPQVWYYFVIPQLFFDNSYRLQLSAVILCYVISIADTYFRPFSDDIREDWSTNPVYNLIILGLFLLNPVLVIGAFVENQRIISTSLPWWDTPTVSLVGIALVIIGGFFSVMGRAQLVGHGSGVLHIDEDHQLITSGIYGVIRHPIYSGGLVGVVGLYMAFNSVFMMFGVALLYFLVVRHRLIFEEEMLTEEFGDQYREYMKKTKRLFPYIY